MERNLEFSGRSKKDGVRYKGTGVNQICGNLWLLDGECRCCPIDETSLRIRNPFKYGKYETPTSTQDDLSDLQEALMKTVINFCRERNLTDIDCISFGVDGLQDSVEYGEWTPGTDSSLTAHGYQDDTLKLIGEVL